MIVDRCSLFVDRFLVGLDPYARQTERHEMGGFESHFNIAFNEERTTNNEAKHRLRNIF